MSKMIAKTSAVIGMLAAAGLLLAGCAVDQASASEEAVGTSADALTVGTSDAAAAADGKVIPGRYIVVLKDSAARTSVTGAKRNVADVATGLKAKHGGKVVHTYEHALNGMVMEDLSEAAVAAVKADPDVAYVEEDRMGSIVNVTQSSPTWGLDRVGQRNLPVNSSYVYNNKAGEGVHVYIIDTGINGTHPDFGGRVGTGIDLQNNDNNPDDCHGHGTHVAGTVGSATYGVAKKVTLHGVKVCTCGGSCALSTMIAGVDWVTANHVHPAVANMSLHYGSVSNAYNTAVTNSIAQGVTYAIAAANDNRDACQDSPGSTPNAITVGATDNTDTRASFSNFGSCVDVFAPGVNILSTSSTGGTATMSGTSMASPHVAGAAALYLSLNTSATPAQVATALTSNATANVINRGAGSPNRLLFSGFMDNPCTSSTGSYLSGCTSANITNFTFSGSYNTGNIGTTAKCYQTTSAVTNGNCGNFASPRTLKMNSVTKTCNNSNWNPAPTQTEGGYCAAVSSGNYDYAYMALFQ